MTRLPRLLPLVGVAIGGVLAVNALGGARKLPDLISAARAYAETAVAPAKDAKAKDTKAKDAKAQDAKTKTPTEPKTAETDKAPPVAPAADGSAIDASAVAPSHPPAPVCAPTAAELAKEAGLSPAELRVLQSLGGRRSALDQREKDMDVQLALLAAAEAKLDSKIKTMSGLKTDIQGLLVQADAKEKAEADRLVIVYSAMKPKDAAARMTLIDDSVRLPIASKMKERILSAILAQMAPVEAKALTEKLAHRVAGADAVRQARGTVAPVAVATPAPPPAAQPTQTAAAPLPTTTASAGPVAATLKAPAAAKPRAKPRPRAVAKLAPAKAEAVPAPTKPVPYDQVPALPQAVATTPAPKAPTVPPAAKPTAPTAAAPAKTG